MNELVSISFSRYHHEKMIDREASGMLIATGKSRCQPIQITRCRTCIDKQLESLCFFSLFFLQNRYFSSNNLYENGDE